MKPSIFGPLCRFTLALVLIGPAAGASLYAQTGQAGASSSAPTPQADPLQLVNEGRKLVSSGKIDEGIARIDKALALDPKLFEAHLAKGIALDIKGDYPPARKHLEEASALASENNRDPAQTALAISYVFSGDVASAARIYQKLFDNYVASSSLDTAAATANALARVYLESGDIPKAEQWYQTGRDTSKKLSGLPADQEDLWAMRWHHALARIAARRGDHKTAAREAEAVKQLIDKNKQNAAEMPIYHYLTGYTALYAGDYDAALAALRQADQRDPFILGLQAQAYEKKGDAVNAKALYTKVLESTGHSVQNALMRTVAKKQLAALK